jgi:hypothetical protein
MSRLPNPFLSAIRINGIAVWLKPDDLLTIRPGITPGDAEQLLKDHEWSIAACMISAGIEAAAHILETGGHDA